MDTIAKDIQYAVRSLIKARGFALVAIITLALGIGANTAMFSVVNSVLMKPLPFRDAESLVAVTTMNNRNGVIRMNSTSYPDFEDYRSRNRTLEDLCVYNVNDVTLTGVGEATHVRGTSVTATMFQVLGQKPEVGRDFRRDEDDAGHHVAMISHAFWVSHFQKDPNISGRQVNFNGKPYTIVGVMPPGFQFPVRAEATQVWITFSSLHEVDTPGDTPLSASRGAHFLTAIGRLKPGVSPEAAQQDISAVAASLSKQFPDTNLYNPSVQVQPALERLVGKTRRPLMILLMAVGCVLLIACANVANLVLARNTGRSREIAIRSALGATRMRIVRQLITESVLLAALGAIFGSLLATWGLAALVQAYPDNLPRMQQIGIDGRVLLFTAGLAIFTGILFGLVPALRVSSPNLTEAMRDGGRGSSSDSRHARLRSAIVISETAIGVMLLIGAGLLIRSLQKLTHVELGLNPSNVLTASVDLSESKYHAAQIDQFDQELMRRLSAIPGVQSAALATQVPLGDNEWTISFNVLAHPLPKSQQPSAYYFNVSRNFFETLQIPLIKGRTFDERDSRDAAPTMIINQSFAKKFFPNEDPIGKIVEIGIGDGKARERWKTREVVGVVGDTRVSDINEVPPPAYFTPMPQVIIGPPNILLRVPGDPTRVTADVRKVLADIEPEAPLYEVHTVEDLLAIDLGRARFQATLLGLFAGVALLLTAIGLYGVMAYTVLQRTHEFGIRMALGASQGQVLAMVLHRGLLLTLSGIGIGVVAALGMARFIESLLYEIPPRDPATYLVVTISLGLVSLLASYLPALRATRVDPMIALRYE